MTGKTAHEVYGDFASILGASPAWSVATFPLRDGTVWEYREPDAVVVVQNGRMRLAVQRFTRSHDTVQILDNPKHMFFSTRRFDVPDRGGIAFEADIRAEGIRTTTGDLYDGFATLNLLDFGQGVALDWFCGHDRIAPVYARLPFPGVDAADAAPLKYFAFFEERQRVPGSAARVGIRYDRGAAEATWTLDGTEVWRYPIPVDIESFTVALGVFTEKDIGPAGSASCHGQGLVAEWSPLEVTTWG